MKTSFSVKSLTVAFASALALTGCLEVEDDSNAELTAALQDQNRILSEQLAQDAQVYTVTAVGVVVDIFDNQPLTNAVVTVRTPTETIADSVAVSTDGQFSVEGIPANSSVEFIVESTDDSFMQRVFYRQAGDATSGNTTNDFGQFSVSEAETYTIAVVNSETNMPIEGLEFKADSTVGTGASASNYLHISSYDDVTGQYIITLPKFISTVVVASIDADRDGFRDYFPESFRYIDGTKIRIFSSLLADLETIYLSESDVVIPTEDLQIQLNIFDSAGNPLTDATAIVDDNFNTLESIYDAEAGQYVLDTVFDGSISVQIPAFEEEGKFYESVSFSVRDYGETALRISGTGVPSYEITKSDAIQIPIFPRQTTATTTNPRVVFVSQPEDTLNNSLFVFYSMGVDVTPDNVSLINRDAYTVVRGDDSEDDLVLPGTTTITGGVEVPVAVSTSYGGTKLTVTPTVELANDASHVYSIGAVTPVGSDTSIDLSVEDYIRFDSADPVSDTPFDIANIVLDNNSYTANGSLIKSENTAGEAATSPSYFNNAYLFFPPEVNQLKQFSMRLASRVVNGVANGANELFTIVRNGEFKGNRANLVSLARNENVLRSETNYWNFFYGTTLDDATGTPYLRFSLRTYDDVEGSENSMTFEYAYETKAGETKTGVITLPVQ